MLHFVRGSPGSINHTAQHYIFSVYVLLHPADERILLMLCLLKSCFPGLVCLVDDKNIHFDNLLQSLTKQTVTTLRLYSLVKIINEPTHKCGHIIGWVVVRPDNDMHRNLLLQTYLNQTIIVLNPTSNSISAESYKSQLYVV